MISVNTFHSVEKIFCLPVITYIHTYTHTYHFVGPQILSYNSRAWNLSEKTHNTQTNTAKKKHNTINRCQYYSLQNQILCII